MANMPLMPKATAVWLVDNTSLSFDQIAAFCRLHPLEVKAIADGDAAQGIKGLDPVQTGQLTRDEIERAQRNPTHKLSLAEPKVRVPESRRRGPRYTPVSRRQDRPNAILWLLRNHPELKDSQIMRLVGTTKPTIQSIRERTHWNAQNLTPTDPVALGLCSQIELDLEVEKAAKNAPHPIEGEGSTLLPVDESTAPDPFAMIPSSMLDEEDEEAKKEKEEALDAERVFAKLNAMSDKADEEEARRALLEESQAAEAEAGKIEAAEAEAVEVEADEVGEDQADESEKEKEE